MRPAPNEDSGLADSVKDEITVAANEKRGSLMQGIWPLGKERVSHELMFFINIRKPALCLFSPRSRKIAYTLQGYFKCVAPADTSLAFFYKSAISKVFTMKLPGEVVKPGGKLNALVVAVSFFSWAPFGTKLASKLNAVCTRQFHNEVWHVCGRFFASFPRRVRAFFSGSFTFNVSHLGEKHSLCAQSCIMQSNNPPVW